MATVAIIGAIALTVAVGDPVRPASYLYLAALMVPFCFLLALAIQYRLFPPKTPVDSFPGDGTGEIDPAGVRLEIIPHPILIRPCLAVRLCDADDRPVYTLWMPTYAHGRNAPWELQALAAETHRLTLGHRKRVDRASIAREETERLAALESQMQRLLEDE